MMQSEPVPNQGLLGLVLVPTRELAIEAARAVNEHKGCCSR